jgi:dienelactone hydrolase
MRILLILACLSCLCRLSGTAEAYEQVKIPSANGELTGVLYKPDKTTGPVPAVIALHGCGGLGTHKKPIGARFAAWGLPGALPSCFPTAFPVAVSAASAA